MPTIRAFGLLLAFPFPLESVGVVILTGQMYLSQLKKELGRRKLPCSQRTYTGRVQGGYISPVQSTAFTQGIVEVGNI